MGRTDEKRACRQINDYTRTIINCKYVPFCWSPPFSHLYQSCAYPWPPLINIDPGLVTYVWRLEPLTSSPNYKIIQSTDLDTVSNYMYCLSSSSQVGNLSLQAECLRVVTEEFKNLPKSTNRLIKFAALLFITICLSVCSSDYLVVLWNNRHSLSIPHSAGRTLRYFYRSIESSWEIRWKLELKNDSEHAVLNTSFREISMVATPPMIFRLFDGHTQQTWIINKTPISFNWISSVPLTKNKEELRKEKLQGPLNNHQLVCSNAAYNPLSMSKLRCLEYVWNSINAQQKGYDKWNCNSHNHCYQMIQLARNQTWHLRRKMWNFTDREAVWVTLMQIHHPPNFDRRVSGSDKREIHFLAGGVSFAKVWIRSVVVVWQAKVVQTSWDAGTWIYQPTRRRLCQQLECSVFQSLRTRFCEQST